MQRQSVQRLNRSPLESKERSFRYARAALAAPPLFWWSPSRLPRSLNSHVPLSPPPLDPLHGRESEVASSEVVVVWHSLHRDGPRRRASPRATLARVTRGETHTKVLRTRRARNAASTAKARRRSRYHRAGGRASAAHHTAPLHKLLVDELALEVRIRRRRYHRAKAQRRLARRARVCLLVVFETTTMRPIKSSHSGRPSTIRSVIR